MYLYISHLSVYIYLLSPIVFLQLEILTNIPSNSGTCRCILLPKIIKLINSDICTLFHGNDTSY